jgi:nitroreductase
MAPLKFILNALKFGLKTQILTKLPDNMVLSLYHQNTHIAETAFKEGKYNFFTVAQARALFIEAKKRRIISADELEWGENILFNKPRATNIYTRGADDAENILAILKMRRSIRAWTEDEITMESIHSMINAARWAPSSCNRQPWFFYITKNKEKINFLCKIRGQSFIKKAPYCILVLIDTQAYSYDDKQTLNYYMLLDSAAATQNLLLMAHALGLGACWVNLAPNNIKEEDKKIIKERFGIPSKYELITIIPFGKASHTPYPPGRKDISKIMFFDE